MRMHIVRYTEKLIERQTVPSFIAIINNIAIVIRTVYEIMIYLLQSYDINFVISALYIFVYISVFSYFLNLQNGFQKLQYY